MRDKVVILSLFALILGVAYFGLFSGCRTESMQISALSRPHRRGDKVEAGVTPIYPVTFKFNRRYKLTSVKVVAADDFKTNKYPYALWHLVPDTEARPASVKAIMYGQEVHGLKPKIAGAVPDPLNPDTEYVIFIEAGRVKSQTNFTARENTRISVAR
jgi:hypothetical protein